MKFNSKREELKVSYDKLISYERRLKLVAYTWYTKECEHEISKLKMKINKLKFQLWLF